MDKRLVTPEWVTTSRVDVNVDEALRGGWGVSYAPLARNASFTDFGSHEMAVPAEDTPEGRAVRLHELVHARISPTSVPHELLSQLGVSAGAVRLAEEVRVNSVGALSAFQMKSYAAEEDRADVMDTFHLTDGTEKEVAKRAVATENWTDAVSIFLSTYNTTTHKQVKRALRTRKEWRDALAHIEKRIAWHSMDTKVTHPLSMSHLADTAPMEFTWLDSKRNEHKTMFPRGFIHHTLGLANDIDAWLQAPPDKDGNFQKMKMAGKSRRSLHNGASNWETMRFGLSALTETTTAFLGKRKRPSMTGKYPSRPDRLLTDPERRIFREPVRTKGGIVIFDASGSMGVTHETILDTVKQFAGATVVVYSHTTNLVANVWVVAKAGRMISREEFADLPLHNGNGVDGEVLRWAIRNRKHGEFILWVSDGQVTGRHDRMNAGLVQECAYLSQKHNIIGVDTCEEAVQLLQEMKRGRIPRNRYCDKIAGTLKSMNKGLGASYAE